MLILILIGYGMYEFVLFFIGVIGEINCFLLLYVWLIIDNILFIWLLLILYKNVVLFVFKNLFVVVNFVVLKLFLISWFVSFWLFWFCMIVIIIFIL